MELGAFSLSLAVKDLAASRAFYGKLGFKEMGGDAAQGWLILRNGPCTLGLFAGHIPSNTLTFNPGWAQDTSPLESFSDVRDIQTKLEAEGISLTTRAAEGTGPAYLTCTDPDGNEILIDQHVDAPKKD